MTPLIFQAQQKVLFVGDSITDCGRRSYHPPHGQGYVRLLHLWLNAARPELDLEIVNRGVSGNTIHDLAARWQRDVIAERPDWLSVKIGVNDVWYALQSHASTAATLNEFERTYRKLLDRTRAETPAELILIEPFLVEDNLEDQFRSTLDDYRSAVRRIAQDYEAVLVKVQEAFDRGLRARPATFWAGDRVHPTDVGHVLIAQEFLRTCGFEM